MQVWIFVLCHFVHIGFSVATVRDQPTLSCHSCCRAIAFDVSTAKGFVGGPVGHWGILYMACSKDLPLEGTNTQTKHGGNLDGKHGGRFLLYAKPLTHKRRLCHHWKEWKEALQGNHWFKVVPRAETRLAHLSHDKQFGVGSRKNRLK